MEEKAQLIPTTYNKMSAKGGKGGKGGRGKSDGKKSVTKSAKVCYNDSYLFTETSFLHFNIYRLDYNSQLVVLVVS